MAAHDTSSNVPIDPPGSKKGVQEHIERVTTREQVPGHDNYYEKNGLRTYGDNEGKSDMS